MSENTNSNIRAKVWLEPGQVDALRTACYNDQFASYLRQRNEAIIQTMYDSGVRVGELVKLDVDFLRDDNQAVFLPSHIQKDYPTHHSPPAVTIELSADTTRLLSSFLTNRWKDSDALFPSRKADRITEQGVRYMLHDVAEAAGVRPWMISGERGDASDVTPHSLRHSVAYRMMTHESGNTLYDVRNRLRHRSIQTTERTYDHFKRV